MGSRSALQREAIVDGASIRTYIEETAREHGINGAIRFGHKALRADWSSAEARWTVEAEANGEARRFTCSFLYLGSGYYDYESGYRPEWPHEAAFAGTIVHPHSGRKVSMPAQARRIIVTRATRVTSRRPSDRALG